jgi:hypothetical protein
LQSLLQLTPRVEQPRFDGAFRKAHQARDLGKVVTGNREHHQRHSQLLGKRVDGLPEVIGSFASFGMVVDAGRRQRLKLELAHHATFLIAAVIEREPPRRADQPGAEAIAIAKLVKTAVRAHERILRDIFRVFPMPQHRERHSEGERRTLR